MISISGDTPAHRQQGVYRNVSVALVCTCRSAFYSPVMQWQPQQRSSARAPRFGCYLICCHSAGSVAALRALTTTMMRLSSLYPSLSSALFFVLQLSCSCLLLWKRAFFISRPPPTTTTPIVHHVSYKRPSKSLSATQIFSLLVSSERQDYNFKRPQLVLKLLFSVELFAWSTQGFIKWVITSLLLIASTWGHLNDS